MINKVKTKLAIDLPEFYSKNKNIFKMFGWKKSKMETEIYYDNFTIDVFICACFMHGINVILIDNGKNGVNM